MTSRQRAPKLRSLSLDAHLPLDRREALAQGEGLPERAWGAVLFADVSGFTPLMERLASTLGPHQAAEEITLLLNALFAPLIAEVHAHGGSIISFGGDALMCWFPFSPPPASPRANGGGVGGAAACALAMLRRVASFPAETPAGPITLAMHIGVATGEVRRFAVGRSPYGLLDVLAGTTVDRMAKTQYQAGTGQVVVDAVTAASLPSATLPPVAKGFFLLAEPGPAVAPVQRVPPTPLPLRQVRPWLAGALYRRLRAGRAAFSAELRLVTSLFVNFDGLDYDHDPDVGAKLQQYVVLAQEHLAPYEGHLAAVTCGDKGSVLYILFGAPIAHEDDPTRAVGFAMALQAAARALPFITAQRVGVGLGRAYAGILGSAERCTYSVLGDEVNTSARLMQAADAGQVLVSRPVQRAAAGRYVFRSLGTLAVKGKEEPVAIFEPAASQESRPAAEVELLVGRTDEKRTIATILDDLVAGWGRVFLIGGEAGVGKSALVRYLLRQAQERGWPAYVGSCLSYGQHIPYLPWRFILEEVHQSPAAGPEERTARLQSIVAALAEPSNQPGYWEARFPLLASAMGLDVPDTPLTRSLEGELRRDNTFRLLEALVRALAASVPAIVVLEDAYWADELSLQLATHIAHGLADLPLLLVVVQRPVTHEAHPGAAALLQATPRQVSVSLAPLERGSALELARQRLSAAALHPELETLLQEKAQGNPFFIEELVRALQDAACLKSTDSAVELCGDWRTLQLPDTIEGLVQARLDLLPEESRLILKVAAVIGRTFTRPLLQEVCPGQPTEAGLTRQLEGLSEAAFISLEEAAPEWRYAFQHPILHEVAYGTLLFAQRRQLHGEIGAVLERWYADDLPRVLDLLAYHYARSEVRAKAVTYLHRAGDKARREYANEVALGYYSQALERLLPEEQDTRYDLLAGRERIYDLRGERETQAGDLREMDQLASALNDARRQVEVLNRQARRSADMGAFDEGLTAGRAALARAREAVDLPGEAEAYKTLGILQANVGDYEGARDAFQQALSRCRTLGYREGELTCLGNLGLLSHYQGNLEEALQSYRLALDIARSLADRRREGRLLLNLGMTHRLQGDYGGARAYSEQAMAIFQDIGDLPGLTINLDNVGAIALAQGDLEAAQTYHNRALELARQLRDPEGEATSLCNLGLLYIQMGQYAQAGECLAAALQQFRQMGHRRGEADALHNLGVLEVRREQAAVATKLLGQSLVIRQEIGELDNALVTKAWLGLAALTAGDVERSRAYVGEVVLHLESEAYGGDAPQQEIWWTAYRVWQAAGQRDAAHRALEQAHALIQEQAGRIEDPTLRRSFLERVPVNREVEEAWRETR